MEETTQGGSNLDMNFSGHGLDKKVREREKETRKEMLSLSLCSLCRICLANLIHILSSRE